MSKLSLTLFQIIRVRSIHKTLLFFLFSLLLSCGSDGQPLNEDEDIVINPPPVSCVLPVLQGTTYYVATDGDDTTGVGTTDFPWATITHALDNADDGSTILVRAGTYTGRIRIRGSFATGVTVRSETPYMAKLRNNDRVLTFYTNSSGCEGITLEGFDIAHNSASSSPIVVHIEGGGNGGVSRITLRNNILHDSFNNDIIKLNNSAVDVTIERNIFYNQGASDEHIDINSVENITVQDNVFFNDFSGSGRTDDSVSASFIVIKDSNSDSDLYVGSRNINVRRNVFLNWQGSIGAGFLLIGEDGMSYAEAFDVLVENNLFLGNSSSSMRAPFGIKGGRDITFQSNTIVGDLPANAFAVRINREGANIAASNINFYNNIWSDSTGTMIDFSDTLSGDVASFVLSNNLYWNAGNAIPNDSSDSVNYANDASSVSGDPGFQSQSGLVIPRWLDNTQAFADGSGSVCEVFLNLVENYGIPSATSVEVNNADASKLPSDDISGNVREGNYIGAYSIQ